MKAKKLNALLSAALLSVTLLTSTNIYASSNSNNIICDDPENVYVPDTNKPSVPGKPEISWPSIPSIPDDSGTTDKPEPPSEPINHTPYIKGYEDGTFRAERNVTREEIATMIARLMLDGKEPEEISSFEDISGTRYSNKYVGYLEKLGVVTGYEDGNFRPYEPVTRAEMAAMIAKVEQIQGKSNGTDTYVDVAPNHWAADDIEAVTARGYMEGYSNEAPKTFKADQYLTRVEAVLTLNRVFTRECSDANIPNLFSDLDSSYWAYDDILFAAVQHTHQ